MSRHPSVRRSLLVLAATLTALIATAGQALATTVTVPFAYTGAAQTWTVPAGVTSATFDLYGAQGGIKQPGPVNLGGQATATLTVMPGETVNVLVGGAGNGNAVPRQATGGFNGGGGGYSTGGGASDIRIGGSTLADRVLVAGGGGGDGGCQSGNGGFTTGGGGGGLTGAEPNTPAGCTSNFATIGGGGGTQSAGGTSGAPCSGPGQLGLGGADTASQFYYNGGGGGGWYGGGAGCGGGGGGGGSGHGPVGTVFNTAVQTGNGKAVITYEAQTLGVSRAGTGSGSVTSTPAGIDCGATCSADFGQGSTVTLTASAAAGSDFAGWSGACSGTGTCSVTMDAAKTATATFAKTPRQLSVAKTGTGSGTVTSSPGGIDCGAACSASFDHGTSVTLTAAPAAGVDFTGWGGDCTGTASTCTVSMDAARSVTATFEPTVTALAVTPNTFKPGSKDTPLARRAGTKIAISVSGDATVRFSVRRSPNRKGPRITASFTRVLTAGDHKVAFSGKLNGRAYSPGKFTLQAIAVDTTTGHESAPVRTGFRVTK